MNVIKPHQPDPKIIYQKKLKYHKKDEIKEEVAQQELSQNTNDMETDLNNYSDEQSQTPQNEHPIIIASPKAQHVIEPSKRMMSNSETRSRYFRTFNQSGHSEPRSETTYTESETIDLTAEQRAELVKAFEKMDTDGDGFISKDQLRDFVRSLGEHDDELVANMMATADQAKDGRIGVAQFCRAFE